MSARKTFLLVWIILATVALLGYMYIYSNGLIESAPATLSINNVKLCNGEKLAVDGNEETYSLHGTKFEFCGNLLTDVPTYLLAYLYFDSTDSVSIGKYSDLKFFGDGNFRIEVDTHLMINPGKYIVRFYHARKLISEYVFFIKAE